jgi:flagella basal body P-ring formation protein FlgA
MVIAPAPSLGQSQNWSRDSLKRVLELKGISDQAIEWAGAESCRVTHVEGSRDSSRSAPSGSNSLSHSVQTASAMMPKHDAPIPIAPVIDRTQFVDPSTTPLKVTIAERHAADAISNYLQTKTSSNAHWVIKAHVPTEHGNSFNLKQQIKGVAGGQPPWEGDQEFIFLIKGPNGEQTVHVQANVRLPEMVFAANRQLAKGYILRESDLVWIPMPRGLSYGPEECFDKPEQLIGKQLRRSMSTQQVIRQSEVGPPTVIHVGDVISLDVVSGEVTVSTTGRAIESGSMDDLIQVEVEIQKTRLLARVTGPKTAEVIASGNRSASSNSNSQSNRSTLRR